MFMQFNVEGHCLKTSNANMIWYACLVHETGFPLHPNNGTMFCSFMIVVCYHQSLSVTHIIM